MQKLLDDVIKPVATRLGTFVGTLALGYGATEQTAYTVELAVVAAVLVVADIFADNYLRKSAK